MEFAGQQIDYGYLPAAHTDGDLFLHFPKMNVLIVGGVVSADGWPLLDYRNGAWLGSASAHWNDSPESSSPTLASSQPTDA